MKCVFTQEVPQSPFHIKVDPSHDASKVKAEGPGLARTGRKDTLSLNPVGFMLVYLDVKVKVCVSSLSASRCGER